MGKRNYRFILILFVGVFFCHLNLGNPAFGEPLQISRDGQIIQLDVEFADTPERRAKGLMFRNYMAPKSGMLFDFEVERMISMWMKNTKIGLDMLFADTNGKLLHIHEGAKPEDLTVISSRLKSRWVLEVNAGFVKEHKIEIGDRLIFNKN